MYNYLVCVRSPKKENIQEFLKFFNYNCDIKSKTFPYSNISDIEYKDLIKNIVFKNKKYQINFNATFLFEIRYCIDKSKNIKDEQHIDIKTAATLTNCSGTFTRVNDYKKTILTFKAKIGVYNNIRKQACEETIKYKKTKKAKVIKKRNMKKSSLHKLLKSINKLEIKTNKEMQYHVEKKDLL